MRMLVCVDQGVWRWLSQYGSDLHIRRSWVGVPQETNKKSLRLFLFVIPPLNNYENVLGWHEFTCT